MWASLSLGIAVAGCSGGSQGTTDGGTATKAAASSTGPIAKVNDVELPREPFEQEYKATLERYERARHEVRPALKERLKDNIVRRLVDAEIIRQQAQKMNVTVSDEEFEKRWQEHRARYGDEAAFKNFMDKAGTTEADLKEQFRHNLLRERVFAAVSDSVKVSDEQLKDFYEKNKDRFDEPEQVRASHVLLRIPANASDADKKKRLDEAKAIAKQAKKKGADFAALATKHSEDPTKSRGGDLGWFSRGRMVKPFEDAVFAMKDGEVSDVIETSFGYHVIKRTGHKPPSKKTFEDVKERIERQVASRERNEAIRNALQKWKEEAKVEIFEKGDEAIIAGDRGPQGGAPGQPKLEVQPDPHQGKLDIKPLEKPTTKDTPVGQ